MNIDPIVGGYIIGVITGIISWELLYRILKKNGHIK
jgi:hypothetical protein